MDRKVRAEESDKQREPEWERLETFAYILNLAADHHEIHTVADCVVSLFSMLQSTGWINNREDEL